MWGLFLGAAAAALAPAGPGALVPIKLAVASADSIGNDVYVAVVVDFGTGSSIATVSTCVPVPSSAHDSDALAAAVGSANVAYNSSGLLCSIDNYPPDGVQNCGQSVGPGDYDYWSYWHGSTGSWVYANDGPAEQPVSTPSDDVQGWMYQSDEPDNSTDPPPRVTPSYAQICNAATEAPPSQSSPGAAPTTTPSTAAAPSTAPTSAASKAGLAPTTTTSSAAAAGTRSALPTTTTTTVSGTTTTTHGTGDDPAAGGTTDGSSGRRSIAAGAVSHRSGGSPSNLLPVVLIAAVVAALGGLAVYRWRRRPAEE
jgi:hypothetical protein